MLVRHYAVWIPDNGVSDLQFLGSLTLEFKEECDRSLIVCDRSYKLSFDLRLSTTLTAFRKPGSLKTMVIAADNRVQPLAQRSPKKHNHYSLADFFQFDAGAGTVTDWNGSRNVLTSEDFIIGLQEGLEEEVGEASSAIMYAIGLEWGKQDSLFFNKWFEREFGMSTRQANLMFLLETWWWPFTAQGWGRWEVDMADRQQGFMFINLFDSAVARTLGDVGKPVCHLYAGLFAGFFTEMVRKQLNCIEIQCYSMGETYCKFLLGGKERIDAAAFWMTEGASARDIEKRLRSGEERA